MWAWIVSMIVLIIITKLCLSAVGWVETLVYVGITTATDPEDEDAETNAPKNASGANANIPQTVRAASVAAYVLGLAVWLTSAAMILFSIVAIFIALHWLTFALLISPLAWLYFAILYTSLRLGTVSVTCARIAWRQGGIRAIGLLIAPVASVLLLAIFFLIRTHIFPVVYDGGNTYMRLVLFG